MNAKMLNMFGFSCQSPRLWGLSELVINVNVIINKYQT